MKQLKEIKPTVISLAFDPEGSGPDTHYKELQTIAEAVRMWKETKDLSNLRKKNIKIFNSLEKCLAEKPNIGFITNETAYHIPIAKQLAKRGIDLFIEKPLSNSKKDMRKYETWKF